MDQHLNMEAVCRAGAGETLRARGVTAQAIRAAARRILDDGRYSAAAGALADAHRSFAVETRFPALIREVEGRPGRLTQRTRGEEMRSGSPGGLPLPGISG